VWRSIAVSKHMYHTIGSKLVNVFYCEEVVVNVVLLLPAIYIKVDNIT